MRSARIYAGPTVALVAALVVIPAALAHATLVSSTPSNDEVLARAPARVVLRFDEPVETAFGSVRVYGGSARRVDEGGTTRPDAREVAVDLRPGLRNGTYTVTWRVLSADSHPVSGAFVFHVGKPGPGAGGIAGDLDEQSGSQAVDLAFWLVRFLSLALILLAVGGAIVLLLVLVREERGLRKPLWKALAAAGFLLALVSLAGIGIEGAQASGLGLDAAVRPSVVGDVLETRFGRIWLLRAALAALVAGVAVAVVRKSWRRETALASAACGLGVVIALTPALSGHARVEGGAAVVSDWVHVLAASAWAGGLAFVVGALWRAPGERWALAARVVPRFSALAVLAVATLLVAGVVNGYLELRSWSALWETTYGRLLLAKIALVLPVFALGAFNNRFSVPRLRAGIASEFERRRFLLATATELILIVIVVGVTAALVGEPPAKAAQGAQAGPVSRDVLIHPFQLSLLVDPGRTGPNEIHIYLLDHITGRPAKVDEVRIAASRPAAGIGPLRLKAVPGGPGHVVVPSANLPLAGSWKLRIDIRRGEFDQWSTTVTVPITKEPTSK